MTRSTRSITPVHLGCADRRARARTRCNASIVALSSSRLNVGSLASVLSTTSCSRLSGQWRSMVGGSAAGEPRRSDGGATRLRAEDPGQVGDEISDRAAALAPGTLGLEDLHARLGETAEVGERELGLRALGVHRAQLVERAHRGLRRRPVRADAGRVPWQSLPKSRVVRARLPQGSAAADGWEHGDLVTVGQRSARSFERLVAVHPHPRALEHGREGGPVGGPGGVEHRADGRRRARIRRCPVRPPPAPRRREGA